MKTLTISIAAYNMEKYIEKTLDSLMDERVIDDLEIFVVDDGGKDRTLEIARSYAAKYPHSVIPVHKENGGYGTTVNYSIAHGTGKYFKLLDGDDWFDGEALCKLVAALKGTDADVVFTPYLKVYENGTSQKLVRVMPVAGISDGGFFRVNELKSIPGMWAMVYKTAMLRAANLQLPPHRLYTDSIYNKEPLAVCQSAQYIDACVYCYRLGREGQSATRTAYVRHADDGKTVVKHLCTFYEHEKLSGGQNLDLLKQSITGSYLWGLRMGMLAPVSKEALRLVKGYENEVGQLSQEIYHCATKKGKFGRFLWLCRKTNYAAYWLLKLVPGGLPFHV